MVICQLFPWYFLGGYSKSYESPDCVGKTPGMLYPTHGIPTEKFTELRRQFHQFACLGDVLFTTGPWGWGVRVDGEDFTGETDGT